MVTWDWARLGSTSWRSDLVEEIYVYRVVVAPLPRQVVLVVDGLNRTNRLAGTAVHAFVRVYVKHAIALVDAINWAFIDAGPVLQVYTGKRYYVGQLKTP